MRFGRNFGTLKSGVSTRIESVAHPSSPSFPLPLSMDTSAGLAPDSFLKLKPRGKEGGGASTAIAGTRGVLLHVRCASGPRTCSTHAKEYSQSLYS